MTLTTQQLWILIPCLIGAVVLWFAPAPSVLLAKLRRQPTEPGESSRNALDPRLAAIYGLDVAIAQLQTIGALEEANAKTLTLCDAHASLRADYLPYITDKKAISNDRAKPKA